MTILHCRGGYTVRVIDDDHWSVPTKDGSLVREETIDLTRLPTSVRSWWRAVLSASYQTDSLAQAYGIWNTALWFNRYLGECSTVTTHLDSLTATDWGAYASWLTQQVGGHGRALSHDYRRGQFIWLAAAVRHAMMLDLPGASRQTLDHLRMVSRRAFKGGASIIRQRIEKRALTAAQYTDLYAMLAEEWQRYQDGAKEADLPTMVACWLAFNDGVRSAEINNLTIGDILPDERWGKHRLRVHAPNKEADMVPIEKDTLALLQALVDDGAPTRGRLATDLLFVSPRWGDHILTTGTHINKNLRRMIERHGSTLPADMRLPDGRTTLGTHLARGVGNRDRVRRIMRHRWASTTETFYRAHQKIVVAGQIARALRAEVMRLTVACQRPVVDIDERPDQVDILARNPGNADFEFGNCGLDTERKGTCRQAKHCFECPLLVPWVSKRHNYVYERDEYVRRADEAANPRDRENYLYHASQAQAYIVLIDRRIAIEEENAHAPAPTGAARQRRPRRPQPAATP